MIREACQSGWAKLCCTNKWSQHLDQWLYHNTGIVYHISAVGYATQLHYWTQATGQLASKTLLPSGQKGQKAWLSHPMALPHKWYRWPELTSHWPKQIIELEVHGARIHILLSYRQERRIKPPMMGRLQHSSECSWLTKEDIENISNPSFSQTCDYY